MRISVYKEIKAMYFTRIKDLSFENESHAKYLRSEIIISYIRSLLMYA